MSQQTARKPLFNEMIGESASMQQLRQEVIRLASFDVNVLLQGESGTGKELVARNIHCLSHRAKGPFIGVNCAAIHESLLESELFGHEAGAFTGAGHATLGFLRAADGGTILLDEVGDMSEALQSKLLRVLEDRAVVPVGGTVAKPMDIRLIAATHRDLSKAVQEGYFRQDLYYRLNVVRLLLPPLREHRADIPLLAEQILGQVASMLGVPIKRFSKSAMEAIIQHDWPGNIRELRNVIERAYVLAPRRVIGLEDLPEEVLGRQSNSAGSFPTLEEAIQGHLRKAWQLSGGVRRRAAQMLAIDRKRLQRMMYRYNVA